MYNCKGCKYANWNRTSKGHLHPDGGGWCMWAGYVEPPIPRSMWWTQWRGDKPKGGHIDRKKGLVGPCSCYEAGEFVKPTAGDDLSLSDER